MELAKLIAVWIVSTIVLLLVRAAWKRWGSKPIAEGEQKPAYTTTEILIAMAVQLGLLWWLGLLRF